MGAILIIFLSTLSLRRATKTPCVRLSIDVFLSTLSLRRATRYFTYYFRRFLNFYPRSPCGERLGNVVAGLHMSRFLSTLSLRRATWPGLLARPFFIISIHALLAESDHAPNHNPCSRSRNFYPRSPCGERHRTVNIQRPTTKFLSTLSLRRATARRVLGFVDPDISIHALLAESDRPPAPPRQEFYISIHALLAESDSEHWERLKSKTRFLSTLSLRRATLRRHKRRSK